MLFSTFLILSLRHTDQGHSPKILYTYACSAWGAKGKV